MMVAYYGLQWVIITPLLGSPRAGLPALLMRIIYNSRNLPDSLQVLNLWVRFGKQRLLLHYAQPAQNVGKLYNKWVKWAGNSKAGKPA